MHYTPACYRSRGPHDIAGALLTDDGRWHVMGYCAGDTWQHYA